MRVRTLLAVKIENNADWNFSDLETMLGSTKTVKRSNGECEGILMALLPLVVSLELVKSGTEVTPLMVAEKILTLGRPRLLGITTSDSSGYWGSWLTRILRAVFQRLSGARRRFSECDRARADLYLHFSRAFRRVRIVGAHPRRRLYGQSPNPAQSIQQHSGGHARSFRRR